ncbi:AAA domain-containing protein [Portibacter lacus]|uniref:Helicase n=1 Tax=Portibacter lacus TaxID=1099794 RepID=A0AA37SL80_9BACT|nr:AAA domain-containing protein [Portibacter lacus]GLR15694.1 helicase [Portibacter lacus]
MEENRYLKLLQAIEAEREEEEKYYLKLRANDSRQEKIKSGILLYPLSLERSNYTIGERVEIVFYRTKNKEQSHKFRVGSACVLHIEGREETYKASIAFSRRNEFRVILSSSNVNLGDFPKNGWFSLELSYDEKPYRVMRDAINQLLKTKSIPHQELRDGVSSLNPFKYKRDVDIHYHSASLNDAQNTAVNEIVKTDRISIIHGPPGTGKTTTIVALVKALLKDEKRVLVCAPSNNAVDLLANRLDKAQVKVLRLGNITRIDDNIGHLTLDEKSRNHADWSHIKKVKIEAEEAKRIAGTYKRKFGSDERSNRSMMYQEAKELRKWARDLEDRLVDNIVMDAEVIAATLIGIEHKVLDGLNFETVIIDEASQALEPECWNAILRAKRVILVGDHLQLAPTVKSRKAIELGLEDTLLHRLADHIAHSFLLNVQYRMNDKILSFSNVKFYEDRLISGEKVASWTLPNDPEPLVLIDTSGCGFDEDFNYKTRSLSNEGEYFILREFLLTQTEKMAGSSIGIISPYAEQVRLIRAQIAEDVDLKKWDIQVDTIDGFQGQEKDVICISLVRSNTNNEIGFLKDARRLNVAMTRAKKKLVMVGDFATLSNNELFSDLIKHVEEVGNYKSAWEFMTY